MELVVKQSLTGKVSTLCWIIVLALMMGTVGYAQSIGSISGKVKDAKTGSVLPFVNIAVKGTGLGAAATVDGDYSIRNVPPGTYAVVFSAVGYSTREVPDVRVTANQTTQLNVALDPSVIPLSEVLVYGASRRQERITDAPAAVSVVEAKDIKLKSSYGQVPRLLEGETGVDLVQAGDQDFNINTRGFNSSITRRVLVLMDGRDLASGFLGHQEWGSITMPLDDFGRIEFVRGPGSALYGTNAFNGVINITTLAPREALGTKVSLTGGELGLFRGDIRHAATMGEQWSYKINLGRTQSKLWEKSRVTGPFEYAGLTPEVRPLDDKNAVTMYGSARVDHHHSNGSISTVEGGMSQIENSVLVTGIGRLQVGKGLRPWGRLHYGSERLDVSVWGQWRSTSDPIHALSTGAAIQENSSLYQAEAQYNFSLLDDRLRVILGGLHRLYYIDMEETAMEGTKDYNLTAFYGQVEFSLLDQLKLVGAGRMDQSTYEKELFSPRAALVWTPFASHSFRAGYNEAFLLPSTSEYFLRVQAGQVDLSALGINPGKLTRVLALGNQNLVPEKIKGYEVGYKGVFLNGNLFITIDGYMNRLQNFITDLLQGVNMDYPFNGAPAGLAEFIRKGLPPVIPAIPGLTILPSGETAIVLSYTNKGLVDERGAEVGINYYAFEKILFSANWSLFDFDVKERQEGDQLLPNGPKNRYGFGVTYRDQSGIELSLSGRHVEAFKWAAGVFVGDIPAYTLFNLATGYQLSERFRVGLNVSNLLDNKKYQIFGGSLIGRQAIGTITATF